jgi:hypothetical protein
MPPKILKSAAEIVKDAIKAVEAEKKAGGGSIDLEAEYRSGGAVLMKRGGKAKGETLASIDTGRVEMGRAPGAEKAERILSGAAEFIPGVAAGKSALEGEYQKALIEAGLDVAGGPIAKGLGAAIPAVAGIFIGPKSKLWDKTAAKEFAKLEKAGASPQEAWQQTGTFRSPDGILRQEISDQPSRLRRERMIDLEDEYAELRKAVPQYDKELQASIQRGEITEDQAIKMMQAKQDEVRAQMLATGKEYGKASKLATPGQLIRRQDPNLSQTLYHPELFKAYPQLKHIRTEYKVDPSARPRGHLTVGEPLPWSSSNAPSMFSVAPTTPEARNIILHEAQHGIQRLENMGVGGNPNREWGMLPSEMHPVDYVQRLEQSREGLLRQLDDLAKQIPEGGFDFKSGEMSPLIIRSTALSKRIQNTEDAIRAAKQGEYHPLYQRMAGEAEARAVQKRMTYGPEYRREIFPLDEYDVPIDQLVVRTEPYANGGSIDLEAEYRMGKGGVIKSLAKAIAKELPEAKASQKTQIRGTEPTYRKAYEILEREKPGGRTLDYGAGLGHGSKLMGAESFEPFPREGFSPTFIRPEDIPTEEFDRLVNLNVLNVMPREMRDATVENIGRVMRPGGMGIVTTRGRDVLNAAGEAGPEPMSKITSIGTYQKGFTPEELREYLEYILGRDYSVSKLGLGPAGAMIKKKANGGPVKMAKGGDLEEEYNLRKMGMDPTRVRGGYERKPISREEIQAMMLDVPAGLGVPFAEAGSYALRGKTDEAKESAAIEAALIGVPGAAVLAKPAYRAVKKGVQKAAPAVRDAAREFLESGMESGLVQGPSYAVKPSGERGIVLTAEEQSVIDKFGQKQEREAVRSKKVQNALKESASESLEGPIKSTKTKKPRVKVEPDFYRKMAEEQGDEAVLRAARAGKHLKPTGGGYIGAPRTVTSPQGLGVMRRDMDKDFADAVDAVRLADPERLGTWYDRAKQGIAESVEPYQLARALEQHGVYSAGVSPESELTFALKHLNSRVAGNPKMAYRGAGMRNLDEAVAEDRPANMGFKIGEYAQKNDPRVPNAGLFGVNDFRRAQGMGYTDPEGNPWKAGVSDTMHPFMDAETALQVDRANAAGIGGRTDWAGPHIQEVPWVYGKAQDLYSRGKRGRYAGDELEGIKTAIQDANNTARDYMYKHAASATHEAIPGASLNHVRQALDMTPEEKLAYGQIGRWDQLAPETLLNEFPEVGAGNRDIIYGALGYRQLPSRQAQGLYTNKLGKVETNPMTIARPLMDFPTGGSGLMAPDSRGVMDAAEQFRALMDAQEAGAYNLPNTMGSVKGKSSMVLDTRSMNPDKLLDPSAGVLPTSQQLAKMGDVMGDYGFGVTSSNRGAVVFPYDAQINPKEASDVLRKASKKLQKIYPSSQEKSLTTMGYVPGVGKRSPEGPLSTKPFSGEATSDILRAFADLPPAVALNLSESEAVRAAIQAKALRDAQMGGAREDIQETRKFFSKADWPKAVAMMRKGMTPAAALAALGYNINAMAADKQ